jgi:GT2 family glycosyltransferase
MSTRTALDDVGFMDERFFLYLSEVDWAHRFWEHGYRVVYLPSVQMYHYHQRQSKGRFAFYDLLTRPQSRWHLADAVRYFMKHGISGTRPRGGGRQPRLAAI